MLQIFLILENFVTRGKNRYMVYTAFVGITLTYQTLENKIWVFDCVFPPRRTQLGDLRYRSESARTLWTQPSTTGHPRNYDGCRKRHNSLTTSQKTSYCWSLNTKKLKSLCIGQNVYHKWYLKIMNCYKEDFKIHKIKKNLKKYIKVFMEILICTPKNGWLKNKKISTAFKFNWSVYPFYTMSSIPLMMIVQLTFVFWCIARG